MQIHCIYVDFSHRQCLHAAGNCNAVSMEEKRKQIILISCFCKGICADNKANYSNDRDNEQTERGR